MCHLSGTVAAGVVLLITSGMPHAREVMEPCAPPPAIESTAVDRIGGGAVATGAGSDAAAALLAQSDAERLIEACRRHCRNLVSVDGTSLYFGGPAAEAHQALASLGTLEQAVLPEVQPLLARVVARYGTTAQEVNEAFNRFGVRADDNAGERFAELYRGVQRVRASRSASAEQVLKRVRMEYGNRGYWTAAVRSRKLRQADELLRVGHDLDPGNPDVNRLLVTLEGDLLAAAGVDAGGARTWAGNVADFAGPGSPSEMAAVALEFLRSQLDPGGDAAPDCTVLEVAVRGEWQVAETDPLGRGVSWRLPVHVMVRDPRLTPRGLVRVCELALVTARGAPGSGPTPVFEHFWAGRSWLMSAAPG